MREKATSLSGVFGAVLLAACWSQAAAYAGEYWNTSDLLAAYLKNCSANVSELKDFFAQKKTKLQGSNKRIVKEYGHLFTCDQTDPIYGKLSNPDNIRLTEENIRRVGKEKFIEIAIEKLSNTKKKYEIDELMRLASSSVGLSFQEMDILIHFEKARAKSEALVSVVREGPKLIGRHNARAKT